ncbi:MAG: N-acetylglucosaminylphosphatidylinositol deacetylase [Massilia sp.]|jgi:LmbE family N-acetylglucosaminyl deacetylase|nr:N-acetylglucosaminylphosphatidylinositol deacetylase [Massilia sp.]
MPTESTGVGGVALFLFAHQDDEFGVFDVIEQCRSRQMQIECAYFTRGTPELRARRNEESRRVLHTLGVSERMIAFAGDELGIDDGKLSLHLDVAFAWLLAWAARSEKIDLICIPAWEGGHHDHDALHALAVGMAEKVGMLARLRQYALYNRRKRIGPFFNVLSPLAENGDIYSNVIGWRKRFKYLRLCLSYPSQRGTWIGLFPFVLLRYLVHGTQTLQKVDPQRILERPHPGLLYYEYRQFERWDRMAARLKAWRDSAKSGPGIE